MAIKNKDGTVFSLRGPNPLMSDQELWDTKNIVLHNFRWKSTVLPSTGRLIRPVEQHEPSIAEELFNPELEEPQVQVQETIPKLHDPEPAITPITEVSMPESKVIEAQPVRKPSGKLRVHCLPAIISEHKDDLYDQAYRTIEYGEKFISDAGVASQGDLEAVFWTTDPRITPGSILYPMTMEKRWWKVIDTQDRPLGGYFVHCQVSDQQPRFDKKPPGLSRR